MVDIIYKKTGSVFNQHTYWTKQPIESIIYFIEKLTKEGDIILDPFCGSGMTALSASMVGRQSILMDLSPACIHISQGYNTKFDINISRLNEFTNSIEKKLIKYYKTSCVKCNKKADIKYEIIGERYTDENGNITSYSNQLFDSVKYNVSIGKSKINLKNLKFLDHYVVKICYLCACSKIKQYKNPDPKDLISIQAIRKKILFPSTEFFGKECKRNFKKNITKVCDLYSKKNLFALNIIKNEIDLIKDKDLKKFLLFNFTSILFNTSLMSRYRSYENTSVKMGTFYVPQLIKDNNVLSSFKRKTNFIKKSNKKIFKNINNLNKKIKLGDASKLDGIEDNSIDLIYTDPPYGDIINYSELNVVWESWLGVSNNYQNEMIVNKTENKSIDNYFKLFEKFLKEASRVLKKNKKLVLIFHHPNLIFWAKLQHILLKSFFTLDLQPLPTRLLSFNKTSSQHKTQKNTQSFIAIELINKKKKNTNNILKLNKNIYDKIRNKGKSANLNSESELYDYLINFCLDKYYLEDAIKFTS